MMMMMMMLMVMQKWCLVIDIESFICLLASNVSNQPKNQRTWLGAEVCTFGHEPPTRARACLWPAVVVWCAKICVLFFFWLLERLDLILSSQPTDYSDDLRTTSNSLLASLGFSSCCCCSCRVEGGANVCCETCMLFRKSLLHLQLVSPQQLEAKPLARRRRFCQWCRWPVAIGRSLSSWCEPSTNLSCASLVGCLMLILIFCSIRDSHRWS